MSAESSLLQQLAILRAAEPGLRTRDAAAKLGVSEGELVAARCGDADCVRLDGAWPALLRGLAAVGPVQALTRNDHAVIERIGTYTHLAIDGTRARVAGEEIDLRTNLSHWHFAYATIDPIRRVTRRSIQVFDATGRAVHKIHEAAGTRVAELAALVATHAAANQAPGESGMEAAAAPPAKPHGRAVAAGAFCAAIEWTAAHPAGAHLGVANAGAEQVHHGRIGQVVRHGPWFNVMDARLSLHLLEDEITSATVVPRDGADAIRALDASGRTIAWLACDGPGWPAFVATLGAP